MWSSLLKTCCWLWLTRKHFSRFGCWISSALLPKSTSFTAFISSQLPNIRNSIADLRCASCLVIDVHVTIQTTNLATNQSKTNGNKNFQPDSSEYTDAEAMWEAFQSIKTKIVAQQNAAASSGVPNPAMHEYSPAPSTRSVRFASHFLIINWLSEFFYPNRLSRNF